MWDIERRCEDCCADNGRPTQVAFLLGIDRAKFHRKVVPGDQIVVEAEKLSCEGDTCTVKAVAKIDNAIAAEAELIFALVNNPQ